MTKKWFQVPEAWLIVFLLSSAVGGSAALIAAALDYPDAVVIDHAAAATSIAAKPAG